MSTLYDVYCISLERRKSHAVKFVNSLGYYNTIFPEIVLADNLNHADLLKKGVITASFPNTKAFLGKIACTLSHLKVYKMFLRSNKEQALIFEDDNVIPENPKEKRKLIDNVISVKHWDFLNLSPCWSTCSNSPAFIALNINFFKVSGVCANAYLIRRPAAKWMLAHSLPSSLTNFAHDNLIPKVPRGYEIRPRLFSQEDATKSTGGNYVEAVECNNLHPLILSHEPFFFDFRVIVFALLVATITFVVLKNK